MKNEFINFYIFTVFFGGGPLVVEAAGQLPSLPPSLKSGRGAIVHSFSLSCVLRPTDVCSTKHHST